MIRLGRRCGFRAPSWSNYASPRDCQLPAQSKQAKAPERARQAGRQAGGTAGRAELSREGQAQQVATGWHSGTGKLKQQGEGVEQGWHVSPLQPRNLDADPPGGSPQCGLFE